MSRLDLEMDWDSRVFVIQPGQAGVRDSKALPVWIGTKSIQLVRIALGPLTEDEEAHWIGFVAGKLRLPDGTARVFDRTLKVPPGNYAAEVYAYLPFALGCDFFDEKHPFGKERLGGLFRRTLQGQEMPLWAQRHLAYRP